MFLKEGFFTALLSAFVCIAADAFAARPLVVDDARPVAQNNVQISLGIVQTVPEKGGRDQQLPVITAGVGVYKNLEAGLTIQRTNTDLNGESPVRGFEDLHLYTKYNFIEEVEKGISPRSRSPSISRFRRRIDTEV